MLSLIHTHNRSTRQYLADGNYGNTADDIVPIKLTTGFYGLGAKEISKIYLVCVELCKGSESGVTLNPSMMQRKGLFLLMIELGFSPATSRDLVNSVYKSKDDFIITLRKLSEGGASISVKGKSITDKYVTDIYWNINRRRFDLVYDNPLHVAYGCVQAMRNKEKVAISSQMWIKGVPARIIIELFNAVVHKKEDPFKEGRMFIVDAGPIGVTNYRVLTMFSRAITSRMVGNGWITLDFSSHDKAAMYLYRDHKYRIPVYTLFHSDVKGHSKYLSAEGYRYLMSDDLS